MDSQIISLFQTSDLLQNIHLVKKWLPSLEKKMESFAQGCHSDFRLFMSAEPAATPTAHIIPQGILESSIKITNEPPTGMQVCTDFINTLTDTN